MHPASWPQHLHGDDGAVPFSFADCSWSSPLPFRSAGSCKFTATKSIMKCQWVILPQSSSPWEWIWMWFDGEYSQKQQQQIRPDPESLLCIHAYKPGSNENIFCLIQEWPGSVVGRRDCCWMKINLWTDFSPERWVLSRGDWEAGKDGTRKCVYIGNQRCIHVKSYTCLQCIFLIIVSAYHSDQANTERPSVSYSTGCVDNKLQPSPSKGVTPPCKIKPLLLPALTDPGFAVESCCIAIWLPQQIYSGASTHIGHPQATQAHSAWL